MSFDNGPRFGHFRPRRQPVFNLPPVVTWLVGAIACVHVIRFLLPTAIDDRVISYFGFIPKRIVGFLLSDGTAGGAPDTFVDFVGRFFPFVSHIFLHADLMHLFFNLLWLMAFGSAVARRLGFTTGGHMRFIAFFLMCGAIGAAAHLLSFSDPNIPLIGASGAISGLMGGAIRFIFVPSPLYQPRADGLVNVTNYRVVVFAIIFVALNLLIGLTGLLNFSSDTGAIAWQAHLGGFFAGLLLFGLFVQRQEPFDR